MPDRVRFRLFRSIVCLPAGDRRAITIPSGAVLQVPSACPATGIVKVLYEDRLVRVFAIDLLDSGDYEAPPPG